MDKIIKKNWVAAAAHAGSFVLLLILYLTKPKSHKHAVVQTFRYTIPNPEDYVGGSATCNSNNDDPGQIAGQCQTEAIYAPPKKAWKFNIIHGALAFFLVTAIAHVFYATNGFGSGKYMKVILQGWNPYRWLEYAISASIMTVLIGGALGTRDSFNLISLVFVNIALQGLGYLIENALRQTRIDRTAIVGSTVAGWLLFLAMWIPFLGNFSSLVQDVKNNFTNSVDADTGKPIRVPGYVWFIVVVQLLNFASFGIIQLLQVRRALAGNPIPFTVTEMRYLWLSLAGKLGLAGGLAYGLLFRTKDCPA